MESKKRYEKPVMKKVALRPEETLTGACKNATQSGLGYVGNCGTPKCSK